MFIGSFFKFLSLDIGWWFTQ